jgi:hypothetical protein
MYLQRNIEAFSYNHCGSGKAISITYFECLFVALRISVACPALNYFSTLSHKKHYFTKNIIDLDMYDFSLAEIFLIVRRKE